MSSMVLGKCYFFLFMVLSCWASKSVTREMTLSPSEPCPKHCVCSSGSANAIRVDCLNLNLTAVPQDIGTRTTILDLSWNAIKELNGNEFLNLSRLEELNLANNILETIPESAFLNLLALHTLHLQGNQFRSIPTKSFKSLMNLEKLNLASNYIQSIPDQAFTNLGKLTSLGLQRNAIEFVGVNAFEGLVSLKVLEINGNQLLELPQALLSLPNLREFSFSDNKIRYLSKSSFASNRELTSLELSGNPLETFDKSTFAYLPHLKKLVLSEVRLLEEFPEIMGTSALEHLRIDRANLNSIPTDICATVPLLRSLNFKSNKLTEIPSLKGCAELRLIDLSYNSILAIEEYAFMNQENLIDLFLGHNLISTISKNAFHGLVHLQVLDLESNEIEDIHPDAFMHFKELRDLNLGANKFPKLPTKGLQNLRQLKTFNNRELKEFPPVRTFPRINTLALSYAYHCCEFIASSAHKNSGQKSSTSLQETIVWLSKDDVDMTAWNSNISDILPESSGNFSTKFEELANQLWKTFGRDYTIPDNLAQYAEEYFESAFNHEENSFALQCLPEPGPFMPCEDLFGWWSLRCGVWVVFLLALLGNAVVVIVLVIRRSKMDVPRFLVCNLAGADFCMGVYLGILAVVDASTLGEFKVSAIKWQTSFGCKLAGFFGVFSSELSVFTLSIITLERNYAITHAMHLNKRLSLRHAGYIMFIGWTFATVMATLPLVGISDYSKFAICLPFETKDVLSLTYVVFLILINGVAFLILMGCYLKMYCAIRGSQAWNSNDSRIARRMALLVFTDFICWSPIAFFSLTAVCGLQLISLEEAKVFAIFVLPLNSCANPFLYAIFTKQFKKDCIHICKRIEESRVTRGIGRGRHSSNFSNRHTPVTTNSAAAAVTPGSDSEPQRYRILSTDVCHCNKAGWKLKNPHEGWKEWALKYFLCRRNETEQNDPDSYTYAISQIQKNMEKRNKHITSISSENFSSRSDSWRQGNIPLRLMDHDARRGSWSLERKASEDSNISCSRQDSSTSTFHISRSSFSSESSSQSRPTRPLLGTIPNKDTSRKCRENKPKLCRQGAVSDERSQMLTKSEFPRHLIKERNIDGLCPVCAKKVGFKSKELEEKFACFYNKLVESSYGETSDTYSSKKDQVIVSSDQMSAESPSSNTEKLCANAEETQNSNSGVSSRIKGIHTNLSKENTSEDDNDEIQEHNCYSDTKERIEPICRSLVNVNMEASDENSELERSMIPFSSKHFPVLIRSFASHESFNEHKDNCMAKQNILNVLRSSKSENIVNEGTKVASSLTERFNNLVSKSGSASNDFQSSLLTPIVPENNAKKSTSSPNIIKDSERSSLVENKED